MSTKKGSMPIRRQSWNTRRGVAILLAAVMLLFTLPIVGLAIDAGILFLVRARLSSAVDSAALAAGRALNLGDDVAAAQASAIASAQRFFDANFPPGHLGTSPTERNISAQFTLQRDSHNNPTGVLLVSITASVRAPTYFMKMLNQNGAVVAATGAATRRNLVMLLVLDKSASMGTRVTTGIPTSLPANASSCDAMVQAAGNFIDYFSPYDSVGLVTFNATAYLDYAPSTNFKNAGSSGIKSKIGAITCSSNTNTTAALELAYRQIQTVGQRLATNVIVLFSDGVPNAVTANFPVRTQIDDRIGPVKTYSSLPSDDRLKIRDARTPGSPPMWLKDSTVPSGNYDRCLASDASAANKICYKMPLPSLSSPTGTVYGVITQVSDFAWQGGSRAGLFKALTTDTLGTFPSGFSTSGSSMTSQSIAYIPNVDAFGNSTSGPKDDWLFQVNYQCAPASTPIPAGGSRCKNLGDHWSNYPTYSVGSNRFTSGPYSGYFRPDHPNAIGVVSMNSALNEAYKIRSDTTYSVTIDTIYLQGSGSDPVDRDFMPVLSNTEEIPPLVFEPPGTPSKPNPYYQSNQQKGLHLATTDTRQLSNLFATIASSLLRLSQ